MLQIIADVRGETSEPVVPVRWCLSPDILQALQREGAINPHILLSIQDSEDNETARYMVPLEQAMAYVSFCNAGVNTINAAIIWADNLRKLERYVLGSRSRSQFNNDIYDSENFRPDFLYLESMDGGVLADIAASIDINVGEKFFAGEPSRFEKWWVNLWFEYEPRDQCQFRKRRIIAYTVQPLLMLLYAAWMTFWRTLSVATTHLFGIRGAKFAPIFNPILDSTSETWKDGRTSWQKRNGHEHTEFLTRYFCKYNDFLGTDSSGNDRMFIFGLLRPIWWLLACAFVKLLGLLDLNVLLGIMNAEKVIAFVGSVFLVLWGAKLGYEKFERTFAPEAEKMRLENLKRARLKQWKSDDRYVDIVCSPTPLVANIGTLTRPTFTLRFQALKAKVCRPYVA